MTKNEFDKIIGGNPRTKFRLVEKEFRSGCGVFFEDGIVFTYHSPLVDNTCKGNFYCKEESCFQTVYYCDLVVDGDANLNSSGVTVEEKDLLGGNPSPESNPWIEWDCSKFITPPVTKGTKVDVKWRDGKESIGLPYKGSSKYGYCLSTWGEGGSKTVIAYRLHIPTQQDSEELIDVSECLSYNVVIKGQQYSLTKKEANLLLNLLNEAIGEGYEPI